MFQFIILFHQKMIEKSTTIPITVYFLGQCFPLILMAILLNSFQQNGSLSFFTQSIVIMVTSPIVYITSHLVCAFSFISLLILIFLMRSTTFQKMDTFQNNILWALNIGVDFYQQLYRYPGNIILTLNLLSFIQEQSYFNAICFSIYYLFIIISFFTLIFIVQPNLTLEKHKINKLKLNIFSEVIQYTSTTALSILITISIASDKNEYIKYQDSVLIASSLNIINSLTILQEIFINQSYLNITQIKSNIITHIITTILCISISFAFDFFLSFLFISICITVGLNYFEVQLQNFMHKNPEQINKNYMSQALFWKLNCPYQNSKLLIYESFMLHHHMKQCIQSKCACKISLDQIDAHISTLLMKDVKKTILIEFVNSFKIFEFNNLALHTLCHYIFALFMTEQTIKCQEILIKFSNLKGFGQINFQKWKNFQQYLKQKIVINTLVDFQDQSKLSQEFSNQVLRYLRAQTEEKEIFKEFQKIVEIKKNVITQMEGPNSNTYTYQQYDDDLMKIEQSKCLIEACKEENPNPKIHLIALFMHAELFNNWEKGIEMQQQLKQKSKVHQAQYDFQFDSDNIQYVICEYNPNELKILNFSKKLPQMFGYQFKDFQQINYFKILTPTAIGDLHQEFVRNFFETGNSNFFKRKNKVHGKLKNGLLMQLQFCFDILQETQFIKIVAFLEVSKVQEAVLLVDEFSYVRDISEDMMAKLYAIKKLNWQEQINKHKSVTVKRINRDYYITLNLGRSIYSSTKYKITGEILQRDKFQIVYVFTLKQCVMDVDETILEMKNKSNFDEEDLIQIPYDDLYYQETPLFSQRFNVDSQIILAEDQPQTERNIYITQINDRNNNPSYKSAIDHSLQNERYLRQTSKGSSIEGLKGLKYHKKYAMYNHLTIPNKLGSSVKRMIYSLMILFLLKISYFSLCIFSIYNDVNQSKYYYEFIQINHYIVEPLQKYQLARATIQNYHILQEQKIITDQEYNQLIVFMNENLRKQYFQLKNNLQTIFLDQRLQSFIINDHIIIKQQIVDRPIQVEQKTVDLNSASSILLESLYEAELVYAQNKRVSSRSPYLTYQLMNHLQFVQIFDDLSNEFFWNAQISALLQNQREIVEIVLISLVSFILILISFYHCLQTNRMREDLLNLRRFIDPLHLKNEINRIILIQAQLSGKLEKYQYYRVSMSHEEQQSSKQIELQQSQQFNFKNNLRLIKIPLGKSILVYILIFIEIFAIILIVKLQMIQYMVQFPESTKLLKQLSDVSVNIPAGFSYNELQYQNFRLTYFSETDIIQFQREIGKCIIKMQEYLHIQFTNLNTQLSQNYIDFFNQFQIINLCDNLDPKIYFNFEYVCQNTKNEILKLGLMATIQDLVQYLQFEIFTNFRRSSTPILELEAVYLCSDAINILSDRMHQDLLQSSSNLANMLIVICAVGCVNGIFTLFLLISNFKDRYNQQIYRAKIAYYIFPQITLFNCDGLDRELRRIINTYKI